MSISQSLSVYCLSETCLRVVPAAAQQVASCDSVMSKLTDSLRTPAVADTAVVFAALARNSTCFVPLFTFNTH